MKRFIAVFLCIFCLVSFSGCAAFFEDEEQQLYNNAVNNLFDALDNKDVDAIYNLFSHAVQNENKNLKEDIEDLVSIYIGPTNKFGDITSLAGEGLHEMGKNWHNAYTTFPILSKGGYYWVYLNLMYENTFDKSQIGITQLDFYAANDYYEFWSNDDKKQNENSGLNIYNQSSADYNIISINNYPYDYHETKEISLEKVKHVFETSTSMNEFKKEFGEAAATDEFGYIYTLPAQNEENRFLYVACEGDEIIYSEVLSNFSYIESILEEK